MRYAVPTAEGKLALHFGHCESFSIFDVEEGKITHSEALEAPPHQPGLLPKWLAERDVNVVIAGGMGGRAKALFDEAGIEVVVGAPRELPQQIVESHLAGSLATGDNACDH
jgi:predicted Fe-Mo cluster-binding NifX family protein